MPIPSWNVQELIVGAVELPDTLLVRGRLIHDRTNVDGRPGSEVLDHELYFGDVDASDVKAPVVDAALRRAVRRPWWPFRSGAVFMLRCNVRKAMRSVELDLIEEIAFQFPLLHDESWISLDWDTP